MVTPKELSFRADVAYARALDDQDPLSRFRNRFHIPLAPSGEPAIYLCGNSLGLMAKYARTDVERVLDRWAELGIRGYFTGEREWLNYPGLLSESLAQIVGA